MGCTLWGASFVPESSCTFCGNGAYVHRLAVESLSVGLFSRVQFQVKEKLREHSLPKLSKCLKVYA